MKKLSTTTSGFTLIEVLISVGIMLIFLPVMGTILAHNPLLASLTKHKIQAAYAAQQIIETERQSTFISLTAGQQKVLGPENVILDTKGNYNNINTTYCSNYPNSCGEAVITITPAVYTSTSGTKTTNTTVDHFVVQIYWSEKIFNKLIPMTETYAADIANDPMLN